MGALGDILVVDLTAGTSRRTSYPAEVFAKALAGRGANALFLSGEPVSEADPLGPENVLLLSCGLLTGTKAPAASRVHLSAVSPLTGILGSSSMGGTLGRALRSCGVQTLMVRGKARAPVCLVVERETVRLEDASRLWGLDTWETEALLRDSSGGRDLSVLSIGPAGENGVSFACAVSDRDHAAGRTGIGAVMGAKNLKALAVRWTGDASLPLSRRAGEAVRNYIRRIQESPEFPAFREYGGSGYVSWCDRMGILATRNFRQNRFEGADAIDGRRLRVRRVSTRGCPGCPVRCKAVLSYRQNGGRKEHLVRPEFESMVNLGSKCGLNDINTLVRLDNLCSRLGMDSISTGSVIAFAMDLFDGGEIGLRETGGIELSWGNGTSMKALIQRIARRQGLGDILAGGVRRAARHLGSAALPYAAHVKGLELSAYHPSHIMGTALGYMISSRGGDFSSVYASLEYADLSEQGPDAVGGQAFAKLRSIEGKASLVRGAVLASIVLDCLGLCKVPALSLRGGFDLEAEAEVAREVSGVDLSGDDLMRIGQRVADLERLINLDRGGGREDDRLPVMFQSGDRGGEEGDGRLHETMVRSYYALMGWDDRGRPERRAEASKPVLSSCLGRDASHASGRSRVTAGTGKEETGWTETPGVHSPI